MSDQGHYDKHPAYRPDCYVVGDDIAWGQQGVAGNWEAEIARGTGWFGGTTTTLTDDLANMVGVLFDWWVSNTIGMGIAETLLHQDSWEATRTALTNFRIAPLISEQNAFRSYLAELASYGELWMRRRGLQLELGYWSQGPLDVSALPLIGSDDVVGTAKLKHTGFSDCLTEVVVSYDDRDQHFNTDSVRFPNPAMRLILGEPRTKTLEMRWFTKADTAMDYATRYGQRYGRPGINGTIPVKLEWVEAVEDANGGASICGQRVRYDSVELGYEIVFRVNKCRYPAEDGTVCELTVENERAIWPTVFIQPPPKKIGNFVVDAPAIVNHRVVELPSGLKKSSATEVLVLAQRPAKNIVGFHVNTSVDNIDYDPAAKPSTFAAYGQIVNVNFVSGFSTVMQLKLFGVDKIVTQTTAQRDDYNLLCFVEGEILSVGNVTAIGGGVYFVDFLNAIYGTVAATHVIGKVVYFIERDAIVRVSNKNFQVGNLVHFKLQPFDAHQTFDLADVTSFAYTFLGGAVGGISNLDLDSSYVVTSENKIDSRISATWDYVGDQDIRSFNVAIKRTTDLVWLTYNSGADASWSSPSVEPDRVWQVRVQAVNTHGEASAWSTIKTITAAGPPAPDHPTSIVVTPGVQSVGLSWTPATSPGILQTQIGRTLIPTFTPLVFVTLDGKPTSHIVATDDVDLGYFYAVRHVGALGVTSDWTPIQPQGVPLDSVGKQCSLPFPAFVSHTGSGVYLGDADYRIKLVDTQAGGSSIYFSFTGEDNDYAPYSKTGNYKSPGSGSVLPTGNIGAISLAKSDKVYWYATKPGFIQSRGDSLWNNNTNTPADDGGGGSGGTGGNIDARFKFVP